MLILITFITYSSPIHWYSKLQSEIALSTCETKYIVLMCTMLPLWCILDDLIKWFLEPSQAPKISNVWTLITISTKQLQSVIHDDNVACLEIANDLVTPTGPCTHHISIKWHHCKDQVCSSLLTLYKVNIHLYWANTFTKSLIFNKFCVLCNSFLAGKVIWSFRATSLFSHGVFPWHISIRVPKSWVTPQSSCFSSCISAHHHTALFVFLPSMSTKEWVSVYHPFCI